MSTSVAQAFGKLPGEPDTLVMEKAERVETDNQELRREREGMDDRIEAKAQEISGIEREIQRVEAWIREMAERIAERARNLRDRGLDWGWSR